MAELTQRVGVLAEGISKMKRTLVGVVQIDPRKLLDEGVRRELVRQVAKSLHHGFVFNPKGKVMYALSCKQFNFFRKTFECLLFSCFSCTKLILFFY